MEGLNIPAHVGIGLEQEEEIRNKWDTIDEVELNVTRNGMSPIPMPRHVRPILTHEMLMNSANEQYTEMQMFIKAWKDYVADCYYRIKARQIQCENEMRQIALLVKQEAIKQQFGKKKTDPDYLTKERIGDLVEENPRYSDLVLNMQRLKQEELVIEPTLSALSGDLKIISRVVELRRQEWEENRSQAAQPRQSHQRTPVTPYAPYSIPGRIP